MNVVIIQAASRFFNDRCKAIYIEKRSNRNQNMSKKSKVSLINNDTFSFNEIICLFVYSCFLIFSATIFDSKIPGINNIAIFTCLLSSMLSLVLWRQKDFLWVPALVGFWITLILVQKQIFSVRQGVAFETNGLGDNSLLIIAIIFFAFNPRIERLLKGLYPISVIYIVCYIYLALTSNYDEVLSIPPDSEGAQLLGITKPDGLREARLYMASPFVAFAFLYAIGLVYYERRLAHLVTIGLCIIAFYLASTRVASVILLLSAVIMVQKPPIFYISSAVCAILFFIWCLVMFYGLVDHDFNPFSVFQSDNSGATRIAEYAVAQDVLKNDPLFGTGIAPTLSVAYQALVQNSAGFYSATDIGALGVWTYFGLFGVIVFLISTYLCFFPPIQLNTSEWYSRVLRAIGLYIGLYGVISPTIIMGEGRIFFAIILYSAFNRASHLRAHSNKKQRIVRNRTHHNIETSGVTSI